MALKEEFVGITEAKGRLPQVVSSLDSGGVDHVFLMRNNRPAAVLISTDVYDELCEVKEIREHVEDALLVLAAESADTGERFSLDDVLAEAGQSDL